MDAATMRQGAALVRALLAGDDSVRGPLSDWIEEWGLPNLITPFPEEHNAKVAAVLRGGNWALHKLDVSRRSGKRPRLYSPRIIGGDGAMWYRLGTWPAWAWDASEVPSEQP